MRYSVASASWRWIESEVKGPKGVLHAVPIEGSRALTSCGLSTAGLARFDDDDWEAVSMSAGRCDRCAQAIDEAE
jgi:hypothetical protein